ncbi:hypothetical protein AL755_11935 [Arthrobacter sp. ERGS1:01]|uniref:copper resistance CopC family protein n=1 Tax=Arthrobacter sp. ERGS1:01 TaxID=1704044 RepID=UPI0006B42E14|nr:copper resistance CopC family protein [Arthrobacter sp. ERGS1:01]ALE06019.1 hypothetical protein AL755_11935 [Arthrobacter sp. ERGS1:01]
MASSTPHPVRRNPLVVALLSALTLLLMLVPVAAAQAHDVLEGTTPANGSTVTSIPATIGMTFNNTPEAIGSEIFIKDAGGTNWASGPVDIIDNHVTQAVKPGAPAGKYTVEWRVVSSDSHPIEGTFTFTVTGKGGSSGAASPVQAQNGAAGQAAQGGGFPWGLVGGGAGTLALAVALAIYAKRRLNHADRA